MPLQNPQLQQWIPSAVVAGLLLLVSGVMIRSHFVGWRRRMAEPQLAGGDRLHFRQQLRRRLIASGLIGVIGVLVVVGDLAVPWQRYPQLFAVYWVFVLMLTGLVIVLAMFDALATATHTRGVLARLRAQRRQLQRDAAELCEGRGEPEWRAD